MVVERGDALPQECDGSAMTCALVFTGVRRASESGLLLHCLAVCMYVCNVCVQFTYVRMSVMYICMYACMYVCMYVMFVCI